MSSSSTGNIKPGARDVSQEGTTTDSSSNSKNNNNISNDETTTTTTTTNEMILQQHRLQRKKLKQRQSDSSDDDDNDDYVNNNNDDQISSSSSRKQRLGVTAGGTSTTSNQTEEHKSKSLNTTKSTSKASSLSSPNRVRWSNQPVPPPSPPSSPSTTTTQINATDTITNLANQSLNGELSLLQDYEQKGEMNQVFGSQSVLSQELQAGNLSQLSTAAGTTTNTTNTTNTASGAAGGTNHPTSSPPPLMNPSMVRGLSLQMDDGNFIKSEGLDDTNNEFNENEKIVQGEEEEEELSSSNPTQSSISTSKLFSNSIDDENQNDSTTTTTNNNDITTTDENNNQNNNNNNNQEDIGFSQTSFVVNSLPPLSHVSDSQLISDTLPNATLSQISTQSGYDMIIGAAQALAEQEENDGSRCSGDNNDDPIPIGIGRNKFGSRLNDDVNHGGDDGRITPFAPLSSTVDLVGSGMNAATGNASSVVPNIKMEMVHINPNPVPPFLPKAVPMAPSTSLQDPSILAVPTTETKKRARPTHFNDGTIPQSPQKNPRTVADTAIAISNITPTSPTSPTSPTKLSDPKAGIIHTNGTSYAVRRSKAQRRKHEEETNYIAKRAAQLVEQLRDNRKVEKQLLLSMALTRENPRSAPSSYPPKGTVIVNGFYWGQFPPLEKVLRSYMEEYYELSIEKCQSRTQQAFNNKLVILVREEANKYGWSFHEDAFDEKKIRDRIRCFFKTHIQNAKKRLKTMVRNPLKRANAKALANHLDLIEKCDLIDKINEEKKDGKKEGEVDGGNNDNIVVKSEEGVSDNAMPSLPSDTVRTGFDSETHDAAQVVSNQ